MCWIFDVKIVALKDTCSVGGGPAMNMIITRVPVLNGPEKEHVVDGGKLVV